MASSASEDFGQAFGNLIQIVFSPLFPIILLTTCGVAYLLTFSLHMPQFALFVMLAKAAFDYATAHLWAMLGLVVFLLAALPLGWVGFREHATRTSRVIGYWIAAAILGVGTVWLTVAWPFDGSNLQQLVFAVLLFCAWVQVCETIMGTLKLIIQFRPQPGREVVERQKAHGDARLADEAEAVSLLNSKK